MSSPRLFWQVREHPSPSRFNTENVYVNSHNFNSPRRSSIEKLQRASPVKNSSIFAREQKLKYDPTSIPQIVRPFNKSLQGNAYSGSGLGGYRTNQPVKPLDLPQNNRRGNIGEMKNKPKQIPEQNISKKSNIPGSNTFKSSIKDKVSPTKSSLSVTRSKSNSISDLGSISASFIAASKKTSPGKSLHRSAKSVTFDAAPPQINEYEMATPDLSSIGTGSRENSFDSEDEEFNNFHYNETLENDNSFDASLEDIEKTPIVGPDDWQNERTSDHVDRFMSGEIEDPYDVAANDSNHEEESSAKMGWSTSKKCLWMSNAEQRPLPPIPGALNVNKCADSSSSINADRDSYDSRHSSPISPSVYKGDINGFSGSKMTLEERLNLMMTRDDDIPSVRSDNQRERRMRRAGTKERNSQTPERKVSNQINELKADLDDLSSPETYKLPHRISRESILRKINGESPQSSDPDYIFSSPSLNSGLDHPIFPDPDTPIQSTEKDDDEDTAEEEDEGLCIKQEVEEESDLILYDLPELSHDLHDKQDDEDEKSSLASQNSESRYSDDTETQPLGSETETDEHYNNRSETLNNTSPELYSEISASKCPSEPTPSPETPRFDVNKFRLSLQTSPNIDTDSDSKVCSTSENQSFPACPERNPERLSCTTPENQVNSCESDGTNEEELPGTPESVIHHQIWTPSPEGSPTIPDEIATIKSAAGSHRLKTRPSISSGDLQILNEGTQDVDIPAVPPIPESCRNHAVGDKTDKFQEMNNISNFKRSLTLDIDNNLTFDLENDFDRVVQAQKVVYVPLIYFIQHCDIFLKNKPCAPPTS